MTTCYCSGACRETGVCPLSSRGEPVIPLVPWPSERKPPSREETIRDCIHATYETFLATKYEGAEKLAVSTFCIELQLKMIKMMI